MTEKAVVERRFSAEASSEAARALSTHSGHAVRPTSPVAGVVRCGGGRWSSLRRLRGKTAFLKGKGRRYRDPIPASSKWSPPEREGGLLRPCVGAAGEQDAGLCRQLCQHRRRHSRRGAGALDEAGEAFDARLMLGQPMVDQRPPRIAQRPLQEM